MNFKLFGEHDDNLTWPSVVLWRCVCSLLIISMAACAQGPLPVPTSEHCTGLPGCPLELRFSPSYGSLRTVTVEGDVSAPRPSMSYSFQADAHSELEWSIEGPAVRTTLVMPDGDAAGPGIPKMLPLPLAGTYVFNVASNSMAEGIYGHFTLKLQVRPQH